jgi:hypothetical protein
MAHVDFSYGGQHKKQALAARDVQGASLQVRAGWQGLHLQMAAGDNIEPAVVNAVECRSNPLAVLVSSVISHRQVSSFNI